MGIFYALLLLLLLLFASFLTFAEVTAELLHQYFGGYMSTF